MCYDRQLKVFPVATPRGRVRSSDEESLLSSAMIGESNKVFFVNKILLLCLYRKLCYAFTFIRRFYPKRLTVHSGYTFFGQNMCSLGIESTTFALLTQCSTTEPQEHYACHDGTMMALCLCLFHYFKCPLYIYFFFNKH